MDYVNGKIRLSDEDKISLSNAHNTLKEIANDLYNMNLEYTKGFSSTVETYKQLEDYLESLGVNLKEIETKTTLVDGVTECCGYDFGFEAFEDKKPRCCPICGKEIQGDDLDTEEVKDNKKIKEVDVWYIEATTGCSCCACDNFDQGFYFNEEEPQKIIDEWQKGNGNPLASQYAKYGRYYLRKLVAEILPDGRMIVNNSVFDADHSGRIYW